MNKKIRSFLIAAVVAVVASVTFTGCSLFEEEDVVNYWVYNNSDHSVTLKAYPEINAAEGEITFDVPAGTSGKIVEHKLRSHSTVSNIISGYGVKISNITDSTGVKSFDFSCNNNGAAVYVYINANGSLTIN